MVLGGGTITYLADTGKLMVHQKAVTVAMWDSALKQMEVREVRCGVLLRYKSLHPSAFEMEGLIGEFVTVRARLRSQSQCHLLLPVSLLHLIHMEYNESFHQAL